MMKQEIEIFYPIDSRAWREWLMENHQTKQAVWIVFHKKSSEKKSITWSEAVDVALCFGWIDSKKISVDNETSHQYFSRRKPKSTWSKINKQKIIHLIENGLLHEAGHKSIEIAKENGFWTLLDEVEELIIPEDLEAEFVTKPLAKAFYVSLSKSVKKAFLQWIVLARQPQVRQKRIAEIVECAEQNLKPKHFR
ncbi:YdeI/OmpD-associated family protein [Sphingobacterium anhuiense]|uniref:YdeI/OmpD-associated family protein n=1 Tax=Sphingobacterium anhuiense TaxID=493780 RepID=UPI003C2F8634